MDKSVLQVHNLFVALCHAIDFNYLFDRTFQIDVGKGKRLLIKVSNPVTWWLISKPLRLFSTKKFFFLSYKKQPFD